MNRSRLYAKPDIVLGESNPSEKARSPFPISWLAGGLAVLVVVAAIPFSVGLLTTTPPEPQAELYQAPVLRQFSTTAMTADFSWVDVVVYGRQSVNLEDGDICELLWKSQVQQLVNTAGTITINGQARLDDFIDHESGGFAEEAEQLLTSTQLTSAKCTFDILTAVVDTRN